MSEDKRLTFWNIVGSVGVAFTIPYIIYKVLKAVYIKRLFGSLNGKVVVITGASSGLGEALAHEFYKHGSQVVLCARRRQELDRVRQDLLKIHPTCQVHHPIIVPIDLNEINTLSEQANKILGITGKIDILINNGGISNRGSILDTKVDVDMEVMNVNYFGTVAFTKAFLPTMVRQKEGHVVNVSSVQGLMAIPDRSSYSASKHALQAFNDCLKSELAEHNIKVTIVHPGYIRTNLSLNALTATGKKHGLLDKNTENGYKPEYVAEKILSAVTQGKSDIIVASFIVKSALFLRKHFPFIYFFVMALRAKKSDNTL